MAQGGTKLKIVSLAQICFALSLREYGNNLKFENNWNEWKEILDIHFLWKEINFYKAIADTVYNRSLTDEEFFSTVWVVKYHVDKWSEILFKIFEDVRRDAEAFKDKLINLAG